MKPESQRIAIAEACPHIKVCQCHWCGEIGHVPLMLDAAGEHTVEIPDFLTDLNAAHEMEKAAIFLKGLGMVYGRELQIVCSKEPKIEISGVVYERWSFSATAAQRCEAFLKTIGKWVE